MNKRFSALLVLLWILGAACGDGDGSGGEIVADEAIWTDPATGLVWQATVTSDYVDWMGANAFCDDLTYAGRDDWRLPSISELRSLIRGCAGTELGGACPVTDECAEAWCQDATCYPCDYGDGPNGGCFGPVELDEACNYFWSSSGVTSASDRAWTVGFSSAFVYKPRIFYTFHARCVR